MRLYTNTSYLTISGSTVAGSLAGNASTATKLETARTINGTSFDGSANITTVRWGTSRTLTIGSTGKSVNGSSNVSWTLAEIGAAPASHTHTASQVGLGNVQNYGIATQAQAQAGTANNVYMTPLRVKEAISSLTPVTSVAGKTGAVTLSKSDVGLGSVQNYGIATKAQAEAGTANSVYMTPLRVAEAFDKRVVFAQVNQVVPSNKGTVIKIASSPTDYNTIKFDTLLPAGEDTVWIGVIFPSLGNVVVGTPQYHLSESSYLSSPGILEFSLFHTLVKLQLRDISIHHGIGMFRQNQVSFVLTRESGTGALNDIYLHFRFTGLKLA
jgi:hypothetical protein